MARPFKAGLDYFELDCQLDDKTKLIQAEFGLNGFAIVVKLYQKIYGGFGYYCEWNDDILLLFTSENGLSCDSNNLIREIVNACIRRGIFSKELYDKYSILTSSGIQKRYLNAASRRESLELKKEYLLFDVGKNNNNVVINSINADNNSINVDSNTQSREEKRKEENIYQQIADLYNDICVSFPRLTRLSDKRKKSIKARLNIYSIDDFKRLFEMAEQSDFLKGSNSKDWSATFDWLIADSNMAKVLDGNYKNKAGSGKKSKQSFEQREYNHDELEMQLLASRDKRMKKQKGTT